MKKVTLKDLSTYLPQDRISNKTIQDRIRLKGERVPLSLSKIFGISERRFATKEEQVSDLAYKAAMPILKRNKCAIDLLIFAAASSDLIEPATANIVQSKLGLECPTMDIKNACNSFTSAIQTATAFIQSGVYDNILIVNGEKLSEVVRYDIGDEDSFVKHLSGYTLGDAGCAALLSAGEGRTFEFQKMATWGKYWDLCTIKGGGSLAFRNREAYYFESESSKMRDAFLLYGMDFVKQCFKESGYQTSEIDAVVPHQVSRNVPLIMSEHLDIGIDKWVNTFDRCGNTAAASIPLALDYGIKTNKIKKGDIVLLLGLAAGISVSFQILKI
jgi:3-oxoacyl-[acyl-carrier-protein] synthase-3